MKVGIGLPNAVPGTTGEQLVRFARAGEEHGFSSLGTIDRILYGNYEPLAALAAAAAVTERIGLITSVMLGPLRTNAVQTAKQALSVHALSGGRLTLGIGLGAREDDFEISGVPTSGKGERMEKTLEAIERTFADERIGPRAGGVPEILVGGSVQASFERAARFGAGWIAAGSPPDQFAEMAAGVRAAWSEAGNEGEPRLAALGYFALGPSAEADAKGYLTDYYAFLGEDVANMVAGSAATDAETVRGYLQAFEASGCDELILFPCTPDAGQAALLREAIDG
jgi:alkanesulfonate monooxygenase SsuD/methylene tetrahydromethanopterin reductase-like flavin-dependent oxidoreductase (luciferase family)